MTYIPYKYPFKNEIGQVTKAARFFGILMFLSIIAGIYLANDSYQTSNGNIITQNSLKDKISNLSGNIKSLGNKIDSIGYKIDNNTGKLVPKLIVQSNIKTSYEKSLTHSGAIAFLNRLNMFKKANGINENEFLFYTTDDTNLGKYAFQLKKLLIDNGYTFLGGSQDSRSIKGVELTVDSGFFGNKKKITVITVGTII